MKLRQILPALLLLFVAACTQNPLFDDNDIPNEKRSISGRVLLENGEAAEDALVWLEGFNQGCRVDGDGDFELIVPATGQGGNAENGSFRLFIYMGNYQVRQCEIVIVMGKVADLQGDVKIGGRLKQTVVLKKLLDIKTSISFYFRPHAVENDSVLRFANAVTCYQNGVTVYTKTGRVQNGFVIPEDNDDLSTFVLDNPEYPFRQSYIGMGLWEGNSAWMINHHGVQDGIYCYRPWIVAWQNDVPKELFDYLGVDFDHFDDSFLNIPYRVTGGRFRFDKTLLSVYNLPDKSE